MVGSGNPSGTLNLVRKRPTVEPQVSFTAGAGTWDNYRGEIDASSKLNESGSIRGRIVAAYQDKDSFIDAYSSKRQLLYGITEFDLTDATTLTLGSYYNREDNPGADWNGLPTHVNGSFLPLHRSARFSPDWTYWDKANKNVFAEIEHRFDSDTPYNLFKVATSYQLHGDLEKWTVGGAFRTQSSTYTRFDVKQGGYSVADLMTYYRLSDNVKLQANMNNVFDKRYYQSISNPAGANIFGDPRNVMFTVKWSMK